MEDFTVKMLHKGLVDPEPLVLERVQFVASIHKELFQANSILPLRC